MTKVFIAVTGPAHAAKAALVSLEDQLTAVRGQLDTVALRYC